MNSTNYYIQVVDNVRKVKGVSIRHLIEGITSERSYRRYIKNEINPNLETIIKLSTKLGITIYDIAFVTPNLAQKPQVQTIQITDLYHIGENKQKEMMYVLEELNTEDNYFLEVIKQKLIVQKESSLQNHYVEFLHNSIELNAFKELVDIQKMIVIFELVLRTKDHKSLKNVITYLMNTSDNEIRFTEYMYLGLSVLNYVLENNIDVSHQEMYDLSVKVEKVCSTHILLPYKTDSCFHVAYYAHKLNMIDVYEEYIYIYLNGLEVVKSYLECNDIHDKVYKIFGIKPVAFMKRKTKSLLKNK